MNLLVWGIAPALYVAFIILICFAGYAIILDKRGIVSIDEEGNESSIVPTYLMYGSGISGMFSGLWIMFLATTV